MKFQFQLILFCGVICWASARQQNYCHGHEVSIQCEVTQTLEWGGSALSDQCPTQTPADLIPINGEQLTTNNIGDMFTCGIFTATITNITTRTKDAITDLVISTTLSGSVSAMLDGTEIICYEGVTPKKTVTLSVKDFPAPQVSASFTSLTNGQFEMTIQWKERISSVGVPHFVYGYSVSGVKCTPNTDVEFSKGSVRFPVPGAKPSNTFNYCTLFKNTECMASHHSSALVPNEAFIDVRTAQIGDTNYSISAILVYLRSTCNDNDKYIIASIEPSDAPQVVTDYPTDSEQYTVKFSGVVPGTSYIFTLRVSCSDDDSTIGLPIRDNLRNDLMVSKPVAPFPVAVTIIVPIVLVLLAVAGVGGGIGYYYWKKSHVKGYDEDELEPLESEDSQETK